MLSSCIPVGANRSRNFHPTRATSFGEHEETFLRSDWLYDWHFFFHQFHQPDASVRRAFSGKGLTWRE
jgi:hypothetical protein